MSTQPVEPAPEQPVQPVAPGQTAPGPTYTRPTAVPAPPPASAPTTKMAGLAVRVVLTLAGAAGLVIGSFMKWYRGAMGTKISMKMYIGSSHPVVHLIRSAGAVTILIGLIAILGLAPRGGWLTRMAGALGVAAFVVFAIQVFRAPQGTVSDIGPGAWVVLAGSVVALIGGFLGRRYRVVYPAAPAAVPPAA